MNKRFIQSLFLTAVVLFAFTAYANATTDYLNESLKKMSALPPENYLRLSYHETLNELYHSAEPWKEMQYAGQGNVWFNSNDFSKEDSLINGNRKLHSKVQFRKDELLLLDYGHKEQKPVSKSMFAEQLIQTARYTPVPLLAWFAGQHTAPSKERNPQFAVYKNTLNGHGISISIRKADFLIEAISVLSSDDLHGDVLLVFKYSNYTSNAHLFLPKTIRAGKMNGRIHDEITVDTAILVKEKPMLLERPANHVLNEDVMPKPELRTEDYNTHIHFADLLHTGSKVMIVTFRDFVVVAESPLNSSNGALVIQEAERIAPGKPIRYFTFGHHHPDYIGGMRAFVHKGVTILSVPEDRDYLQYLAAAKHTLKPDSLQLHPQKIKLQELRDSAIITDGEYEMKLFVIGEKSGHTKDYTVYYFPKEKLLVEGDLVWIDKNAAPNKASKTQEGLYKAIVKLGLDVNTIIQTWGIQYDSFKSRISFEELKASVEMK